MSQAKPVATVESKSAESPPNVADELRAAHAELEAKSAALTQAKADAEYCAAELAKEREAHEETKKLLQREKKQTAELFEPLEDAKQRIVQLHTQRGPLDPHSATAVTSSPAFEDLPEDHPLKQ